MAKELKNRWLEHHDIKLRDSYLEKKKKKRQKLREKIYIEGK